MTPAKRLIMMGSPIVNAVINGSFEDGITGWISSSELRVFSSEDYALHGIKSLKLISDGSGNSTVRQDIEFPNGNKLYIFGFAKCTAYTQGNIHLNAYDYGNFNVEVSKNFPRSTFDWTLKSLIRTAGNGGVRIYPALTATPIATVYFDAIGVVDITNLPAEQQTLEWCDANIPQMFYSGVI